MSDRRNRWTWRRFKKQLGFGARSFGVRAKALFYRIFDGMYPVCYLTGMHTVRFFKVIGRRLGRVFQPVGRGLHRLAEVLLLRRLRVIAEEGRRLKSGFALAGERVREAFSQSFLRGIGLVVKLPYLAVRRHRKAVISVCNLMAPVAAAVVLVFTIQYWSSLTFALELEYDGLALGYIADEKVYDEAVNMAESRVINTGDSFVVQRVPKLTVAVVPKSEILDETALCDKLMDAVSDSITEGAGLYIDGEFIGAVDDAAGLNSAIQQTLNSYRDGSGEDIAAFLSDVQVVEGLYPVNSLLPLTNVRAYLGRLNVQVATLVTYTQPITFKKTTVEDKKKYLGYSNLKTKGVNGEMTYTAQVITINGVEQSRVVLSEEVTKEPVDQVTVVGAMKYNESTNTGDGVATGKFIWPVPFTKNITSYYGERWGSFHSGIDISAGNINGKPIIASDGGKVVAVNTSGWGGGWGIYVLIDHGNGYQTRYAHCSSITVKKGQKVAQGELIGFVGNTGNSTGPHLHFEVLLNGKRVNPLPYLQAKKTAA